MIFGLEAVVDMVENYIRIKQQLEINIANTDFTLAVALAPSYKQFVRIGLGATDRVGNFLGVGKRGKYRVLPEVAGFLVLEV